MSKEKYQFAYSRILLKVSGESLGSENNLYDNEKLDRLCQQLKILSDNKIEVGIVVGGGNIWRGSSQAPKLGLDRVNADYIGMMATIMNGLVLESKLKDLGVKVIVQSALDVNKVAEPYYYKKAISWLQKGYIIIFSGGTGYPYFTTDTTAALRAAEINAELVLMAKSGVDGVYNKNPHLDNTAVRYDNLSYQEMVNQQLMVMDWTAATMCMEAKLKIMVFNISAPNNIVLAVQNKAVATIISDVESSKEKMN